MFKRIREWFADLDFDLGDIFGDFLEIIFSAIGDAL